LSKYLKLIPITYLEINPRASMSTILDSVSYRPEDLLKLADINPELAAFIEATKDEEPPPRPANEPAAFRKMFGALLVRYFDKMFGPDSAVGVKIDDCTVTARDGYEIPIRTYRPEDVDTEPGPLIITIHGGARIIGGLIDEEGHCRTFVKELGASCVNIDYRLAPEHKIPVGANDCWDVVKWAAEHASEFGADPKKGFIVEGISAGACMADSVIHLARDEQLDPPITGAVQIVPYICHPKAWPAKYQPSFLSWDQSLTHTVPAAVLTQAAIWSGAEENPTGQYTSPFLWPTGHKGLPPVFFQVHGRDHLRDEGLIYERRLREEDGVTTKLKMYPGLPHGFVQVYPDLEISKQHETDTIEGIKWLLSQSK
jgi:acetyl esterase/lipase